MFGGRSQKQVTDVVHWCNMDAVTCDQHSRQVEDCQARRAAQNPPHRITKPGGRRVLHASRARRRRRARGGEAAQLCELSGLRDAHGRIRKGGSDCMHRHFQARRCHVMMQAGAQPTVQRTCIHSSKHCHFEVETKNQKCRSKPLRKHHTCRMRASKRLPERCGRPASVMLRSCWGRSATGISRR